MWSRRGIPYVVLPTLLLSMVDGCITDDGAVAGFPDIGAADTGVEPPIRDSATADASVVPDTLEGPDTTLSDTIADGGALDMGLDAGAPDTTLDTSVPDAGADAGRPVCLFDDPLSMFDDCVFGP